MINQSLRIKRISDYVPKPIIIAIINRKNILQLKIYDRLQLCLKMFPVGVIKNLIISKLVLW